MDDGKRRIVFKRRRPEPEVGPQGPPGADGVEGPEGPEGKMGPLGPQGPAGADGLAGPRGPAGTTGPEGAQGAKGERGPRGPKGKQGPPGPRGLDGAPGKDGKGGRDGKDGRDGKSAYEIWLEENPGKSRRDYLAALKPRIAWDAGGGGRGKQGPEGPPGPPGPAGATPGEPNGFDDYTRATLAWDDATRTLTLTETDANAPLEAWASGQRFRVESATYTIEDVEGDHFLYLDTDQKLHDLPTFDVSIIRDKCFVAYVYWDATNKRAVPFLMCETHGATMDGATHEYLHTTQGTQYKEGIGVVVSSIDGTGADDADAQFSTTAGEIWDEDIHHTVLSHGQTDAIPVLWRDGDDGHWRCDDTGSFPVLKGTSTAYYNQWTGTTWQRTEAGNNNFVLAHLWAVPGTNVTSGQLISIMGQAVYNTKNEAQLAAPDELSSLELDYLPFQEFVPVATLIFQTANGYGNAVAAKSLSTAEGDDFIDWRTYTTAGVSGGDAAVAWGDITGTLSGQADLQAALDAKSGRVVAVGGSGRYTNAATGTWSGPAFHSPWPDGNAITTFGAGTDPIVGVATMRMMAPFDGTVTDVTVNYQCSSASVDGEIAIYRMGYDDGGVSPHTMTKLASVDLGTRVDSASEIYKDTFSLSAAVTQGDKIGMFKRHTTTTASIYCSFTAVIEES